MILDELYNILGDVAFQVLHMAAPVLMAYIEKRPVLALVLHILSEIFDHHEKEISTLGETIANDPAAPCKINKFDLSFYKTMRKSLDASHTEIHTNKVNCS
jgi:hypothetical protein